MKSFLLYITIFSIILLKVTNFYRKRRLSPIEKMLDPGMAPFTGAFMLVAGLLAIELVMSLLGMSLMGGEAEAPELDGSEFDDPDLDADFDADIDIEVSAEVDIDGMDADGADQEVPSGGGIAAWLSFG